jgi:hypothetical protein
MTPIEKAINTLEHISTTAIPANQMRRIIRDILLHDLYPERNRLQLEQRRNQTGVKGS